MIVGTGQHSHEVPSVLGQTVLMRDSSHRGTKVTKVRDGFEFRPLDLHRSHLYYHRERCVLITGFNTDHLLEPYACDLDKGLALVGVDPEDTLVECRVLWDSNLLVVTSEDIHQLRREALWAGDTAQVELCEAALRDDAAAWHACEATIIDTRAQLLV